MDKTFVISQDVINTINSLPQEDRIAISAAVAGQLICGCDAVEGLNSMQRIIFSIIRSQVERATARFSSAINATA